MEWKLELWLISRVGFKVPVGTGGGCLNRSGKESFLEEHRLPLSLFFPLYGMPEPWPGVFVDVC